MGILTIASSKGGPGKTTIAMLLAASMAENGVRVVAIDADPTRSLHRWAQNTYEGPAFECFAEAEERALGRLIREHAADADLVIVDTAGFGNRSAALAMTAASAVLIPALPGEADVTEAENTHELLQTYAAAAGKTIPGRLLFNRFSPRLAVSRHAQAEADRVGLQRLSATLSHLVAFSEMSFSGRLPKTGAAGEERMGLVTELQQLGWLPSNRAGI